MSAARNDITIEQGADLNLTLTFIGSGVPVDVSTWTFTGQVRPTYDSSTIAATISFAPGPQNNIVIATIAAVDTAAISVGPARDVRITKTVFAYDIFATKPDTTVEKIMYGSAFVVPEVTR